MSIRKILSAASGMLICLCAGASDWTDGLTVSVGISGAPEIAGSYLTSNSSYNYYYYNHTLSNIYKDYRGPIMTSGAVSAMATLKLGKKNEVGLDLSCTHLWYDSFNGVTDECSGRTTGAVLYLMPCIRHYYVNRPVVRIYLGAELGVGKYMGFSNLKGWKTTYDGAKYWEDKSFKFEAQLIPFGIEIGKEKWFGFLELGGGSLYCGLKAGAGYRF